MYVLIAGGGKVGANVARTLIRGGHEVTLIEQTAGRFARLEEEFEHQVQHGDATELHILERAGIARPPDIVLALTGDDREYELRAPARWNPTGREIERFDDAMTAFQRHAMIERTLLDEGWRLDTFESEQVSLQ